MLGQAFGCESLSNAIAIEQFKRFKKINKYVEDKLAARPSTSITSENIVATHKIFLQDGRPAIHNKPANTA